MAQQKKRYLVCGEVAALHRHVDEYRWAYSQKQAVRYVARDLRKKYPDIALFLEVHEVKEVPPEGGPS